MLTTRQSLQVVNGCSYCDRSAGLLDHSLCPVIDGELNEEPTTYVVVAGVEMCNYVVTTTTGP